jgi:hypothetical protein
MTLMQFGSAAVLVWLGFMLSATLVGAYIRHRQHDTFVATVQRRLRYYERNRR